MKNRNVEDSIKLMLKTIKSILKDAVTAPKGVVIGNKQYIALRNCYHSITGELCGAEPQQPVCKKCASNLKKGFCVDQTCPYSSHRQEEVFTEG